jgi:Aconitase family (aconitate hydratase)
VLIDLSFSRGSWREVLKVHDPDKVVVVFDHDVPASNRDAAAVHVRGRDFVRRFGIRRFHDAGPDQGISHVVVAENAYCLLGTVIACSDSHTCSAGAPEFGLRADHRQDPGSGLAKPCTTTSRQHRAAPVVDDRRRGLSGARKPSLIAPKTAS